MVILLWFNTLVLLAQVSPRIIKGKITDETGKPIEGVSIILRNTKTVTVTITGTNDTPIAVIDVANTNENTPITIDVLANDTDIDSLDNSSNFTLTNVSITTNNHSTGYDSSKRNRYSRMV